MRRPSTLDTETLPDSEGRARRASDGHSRGSTTPNLALITTRRASPRRPNPPTQSVFRDDEPVAQSHPLLPDAQPPRFGRRDQWDLDGVVERPVNQSRLNYRISFAGLSPAWKSTGPGDGHDLAQPRHRAVLSAGSTCGPSRGSRARSPYAPASCAPSPPGITARTCPTTLPGGTSTTSTATSTRSGNAWRWQRERARRGDQGAVSVRRGAGLRWASRRAPAGPAVQPRGRHPRPGVLTTPAIRPESWFPLVRAPGPTSTASARTSCAP
jgi:hypothetical protein